MFYSFDTVDIVSPVALNEADYVVVEGIRINYCNFQNCNIKNIIFRNCSFSGTNFSSIYFDNVIFDYCIFSVPVMESGRVEINDIYYAPTIFQACTFVGTFINCDIEHCLFEKVCFTLSKFEECSLYASVLNMCALSSVDIKDCNMSIFGIINTDILELCFSDERKSIVDENTFIDFKIRSKKEKDKAEILTSSGWKSDCFDDMCLNKAKSIKAISRIFEINNLSDLSGEYFYQSKLVSTIELASCGYGERPLYTMITIIVTTFLFALIYMFTGINADGSSIKYTIVGGHPVGF